MVGQDVNSPELGDDHLATAAPVAVSRVTGHKTLHLRPAERSDARPVDMDDTSR